MVGSLVNSTASSHLMTQASHCDLDGPLLVATDSGYSGGYGWGVMDDDVTPSGRLVLPSGPGLGLVSKPPTAV